MRSLLSNLGYLLGTLVVFVLIPVLVIGLAAAALLGIGLLLSRVFPVSVFEATLLVTIAAFPIAWLYARLLGSLGLTGSEVEAEEEEPEPPRPFERMIVVPSAPIRRKKKRNQ